MVQREPGRLDVAVVPVHVLDSHVFARDNCCQHLFRLPLELIRVGPFR
jgi:hypothetical protein